MIKARLLACPACARHVRATESSCVFCGLALPESFGDAPVVPPPPRLNRGGLYTYRARVIAASAAALVAAGCGSTLGAEPSEGGPGGGQDAGLGSDAVSLDAVSLDAVSLGDAPSSDDHFGPDSAFGAPLYGAPFFPDAASKADSESPEASSDGAPEAEPLDAAAPRDASDRDAHSISPLYGATPAYGLPFP